MRSYYPVVFIATYFCIFTNNVSANNQSGEHPWDKIFSPYSDDQSELALEKDHRWEICSRMTSSARIAAGAIYTQKNRDPKFKTPSDAADVKELLFDMYPINTETFEDQINQKIRDIAYSHWQTWTDVPYPTDVTIEKTAWNWCIKQPLKGFWELN
ncbi:hypothetical protein [Enterovibrio norvegicus]|uniref:Uncharacterized protein n=1 Tax=Enterovibrio norvegicus TaxID=188144 RepID=A0A2N7LBK7_9GAMM|nr:hypothetical protein [Enterovibrio norvegicus]PMN92664.1 hypothetical protein BCT23_14390 [Enterovibrio norvegicus]